MCVCVFGFWPSGIHYLVGIILNARKQKGVLHEIKIHVRIFYAISSYFHHGNCKVDIVTVK